MEYVGDFCMLLLCCKKAEILSIVDLVGLSYEPADFSAQVLVLDLLKQTNAYWLSLK